MAMIYNINIQIMKTMHHKRESTLNLIQELSPRKDKYVSIACSKSHTLKLHRSCGSRFEVVDGDKTFAVYLNSCSCSCRC